MSWTTPATFTAGAVLTAAQMNAISGDLSDLDSRTRPQTAIITANDTTTSATFTDLAHVGPAVTLTTGTAAVIAIFAQAQNSATGTCLMAVAVSGATVIAAPLQGLVAAVTGTALGNCAGQVLVTGLTPGSNTFTCKYATSSGTTASFYGSGLLSGGRLITVWPGINLS